MKGIRHQIGLPNITAEAWCIYDMDSGGNLVHGKRQDMKREVASLTKMMTFYVSWTLMQSECPESSPQNILIKIPKSLTKVTGTKAKLKSGDTLTLEQLYYGMMLPSGNDAALVIADYFGKILAQKKPDHEPQKSS